MDKLTVSIGLFAIFAVVLLGPFLSRKIEGQLEAFLFVCGVAAVTISGLWYIEGHFNIELVEEAILAPIDSGRIFGIPIGITQAVLLAGLAVYYFRVQIKNGINSMVEKLSLSIFIFILVAVLGIFSSVISAIISSIILVEMVNALPLSRKSKIDLTIIACFSIGLGAALTPIGEPLSTIAISKLSGEPYHAGFFYLVELLAIYIVPGVIAFGIVGMVLIGRKKKGAEEEVYAAKEYPEARPVTGAGSPEEVHVAREETLRDVVIRALKVYVFVMALILLGGGFKPIIDWYFVLIPGEALYWVNMASAILDNATLTAAEIGPALTELQIKSALMGLLIAGGMLIPGNIPNIISANKLGIRSREWARLGVPLGLVVMLIYFLIIYIPEWLV